MSRFLILPGELGDWENVSIPNITRGIGGAGKLSQFLILPGELGELGNCLNF